MTKLKQAVLATGLLLSFLATSGPASALIIGGPTQWFAFDFFFPSDYATPGYPNDNFVFLNLGTSSVPSSLTPSVGVTSVYAIVDLHNNVTDGVPNVGGIYNGAPGGSPPPAVSYNSGPYYSFNDVSFVLNGYTFTFGDPQSIDTLSIYCDPGNPNCASGPLFSDLDIPVLDPASPSLSPTPLPSTWTMMLIGLVGLGFATYRRRAPKAALGTA
jgi:hypothetical protein